MRTSTGGTLEIFPDGNVENVHLNDGTVIFHVFGQNIEKHIFTPETFVASFLRDSDNSLHFTADVPKGIVLKVENETVDFHSCGNSISKTMVHGGIQVGTGGVAIPDELLNASVQVNSGGILDAQNMITFLMMRLSMRHYGNGRGDRSF